MVILVWGEATLCIVSLFYELIIKNVPLIMVYLAT
jgi:hypothetical protein